MSDGEIVSLGTERKFSDRERSMLLRKPHPATFDSRRSPVQACLRQGEKDYPCLSDLSLSLSFCTQASVFAANGVSWIDPFHGERAFLIRLEHPPLRNYEVSLIVPVCTFSAWSGGYILTPIVSRTGPFRLSLCRSIGDNDSPMNHESYRCGGANI